MDAVQSCNGHVDMRRQPAILTRKTIGCAELGRPQGIDPNPQEPHRGCPPGHARRKRCSHEVRTPQRDNTSRAERTNDFLAIFRSTVDGPLARVDGGFEEGGLGDDGSVDVSREEINIPVCTQVTSEILQPGGSCAASVTIFSLML